MLNPNRYGVEHLPPFDDPPHAGFYKNGKIGNTKPRIRSARELRRREFDPIRYVVPGYIAEGCTLLAGRPKLGKSWLVLEMGLAVATGGTCLGGIECEQGEVLYLALEDNERRLQKRIDKVLGPLNDWPESFQYETQWPRANEGGLDAIRDWIRNAKNPRLVIVDVLAMFKPARGDKENAYEADYHAIKGLQALASEFGVAIIVVHHTRKGGSDSGDPFEKVSGTLGLSGAADTTIVLDRDGNGATIYGRGRDIEEIESAVEFNKGDCRWFVIGRAEEVRRTDERSRILDMLIDADEPMGPREISIATEANRNNVDQLLYKMSKAGQVLKAERGRYIHPERSDLIAAQAPTPGKNSKKIRDGGGTDMEGGVDE
jgi:hypothetical protein